MMQFCFLGQQNKFNAKNFSCAAMLDEKESV
jgi:hypothetical protein